MLEKKLMKGNEAFAEAAIRAGARLYFGYPITPQNEIPEYMSKRLPELGGYFVQAESELAAVNMAYGAAVTGKHAFISSSSPGIALMQEGFSFLASCELPLVLLNVSRGGPGVGGIQPGQADYRQATKGGGNGDYHIPVYAPASIQEAVDLLYEAFPLADQWRNPIMVLADGMLGQMMEPVVMPEYRDPLTIEGIKGKKPWALVGHENKRPHNVVKSLRIKPEELEAHNRKLDAKYRTMVTELPRYEAYHTEHANLIFVAFGTMSRIVKEAIQLLEQEGIRAGLIRPITLWPFPDQAFDRLNSAIKAVVSTELSHGQMMEDVRSAVAGRFPVELIYRSGGMVPTPMEVVEQAKNILEVAR